MTIDDYDPLNSEVVECPYDFYKQLRDHGLPYQSPDRGFFLVGKYKTAVKVLKDPTSFSSAAHVNVPRSKDGSHRSKPGTVDTLLTADPPEHRIYREIVNKAFTARRVKTWEAKIRQVTDQLIDDFIETGRCELIYDFAVPLPVIVISDAMRLPRAHLRQFKEWSDTIAELGGLTTSDEDEKIVENLIAFSQYIDGVIEKRRNNLGEDFISDIIRAEFNKERPLNARELNSIVTQFLVAGNETTTSTLASGMWLLLTHPDQMQQVLNDFSLIPNLVEEVLRYEAPVQAHFRSATDNLSFEGATIPEGHGVGVVFGCCNRDEDVFEEPARFDITRKNASRHLSFGQGIHFCPGAPLARLELIVAFEHLLRRLKNIRLDQENSDLRHVPSFTHRCLKKLAFNFEPGPRMA